jgi:hypothetical protein
MYFGNEAIKNLRSNQEEFLYEGFIKKLMDKVNNKETTGYYCSTEKTNIYSINKSPAESIKRYICDIFNAIVKDGVVCFPKDQYYNQMEKDNVKVYIFKVKESIKKTSGNSKTYDYSVINTEDEGNILDLIKKYQIKTKIEDNSKISQRRSKLYKDTIVIVKKVLADMSKEDPQIKKGFTIPVQDEDFKEEMQRFEDNIDNSVAILNCDAWDYTNNKARTEYENYDKAFSKVFKTLKDNLSISIDYFGDWDGGDIVLIDKEK